MGVYSRDYMRREIGEKLGGDLLEMLTRRLMEAAERFDAETIERVYRLAEAARMIQTYGAFERQLQRSQE